MTGVPVFNVNNNCSSGSTGIMMARYLVLAGYDCTLAVGKKISITSHESLHHLYTCYIHKNSCC